MSPSHLSLQEKVDFSPYFRYDNQVLKQTLKNRGLKYSGNKRQMMSRLRGYDNAHTFPFLRLPPELRNQIYKLVIDDFEDCAFSEKEAEDQSIDGGLSEDAFISMQQPSLMRTCSQTRREGLPYYYQCRQFYFETEGNHSVFYHIMPWLVEIGPALRNHINAMHVDIRGAENISEAQYSHAMSLLPGSAKLKFWTSSDMVLWQLHQIGLCNKQSRPEADIVILFQDFEEPEDEDDDYDDPIWYEYPVSELPTKYLSKEYDENESDALQAVLVQMPQGLPQAIRDQLWVCP